MTSGNTEGRAPGDDDLIRSLAGMGMPLNVARVLVFLSHTPSSSSSSIECGTGMKQPAVCLALQYLEKRGWIACDRNDPAIRGRPYIIYFLACPVADILTGFEKEKREELACTLAMIQKLKAMTGNNRTGTPPQDRTCTHIEQNYPE